MAELADALDSKSSSLKRSVGSTPTLGTSLRQAYGWQATRLRPTLQDCAEVSADLSAIASATAEALAKADLSSGNREST